MAIQDINYKENGKVARQKINQNFAELNATSEGLTQTCQQITNNGAITGFVVLTQTAYDALPAGKLTDGKVYMIAGA